MTIEILFPERCNLFGDTGNVRFLKQCLPNAKFIETPLTQIPAFISEQVNLVYMGPMSESAQLKVIAALQPYHQQLLTLIEQDIPMLFIGNAAEILCETIETPTGSVKGLGILPYTAKQEMIQRYNGLTMGEFEGMTLLGFRSQFTFGYGDNNTCGFLKVTKGAGLNPEAAYEGFRIHNLIATYLLGPLLIVNPSFTHWLLRQMKADIPALPFEAELQKAYEIRLQEFKNPKIDF